MTEDDKPPLIDWITLLVVAMLLAVVLIGTVLYKIRQQKDYENYYNQSYQRSELVQPRIVYYPTKTYAMVASITAYTKIETCPNSECITASGQKASRHLIACPYWLELGSKVEIEELGTFICADRTAKYVQEKYGNTFDLWFGEELEDYHQAKNFGRRYLKVKIYK